MAEILLRYYNKASVLPYSLHAWSNSSLKLSGRLGILVNHLLHIWDITINHSSLTFYYSWSSVDWSIISIHSDRERNKGTKKVSFWKAIISFIKGCVYTAPDDDPFLFFSFFETWWWSITYWSLDNVIKNNYQIRSFKTIFGHWW